MITILLPFVFAFVTSGTPEIVADKPTCYAVGDVVEDFTLKNIDGNSVTLSSVASKGAIVIFSSNTCPYVRMYESRINELNTQFSSKGYPVLAINSNDTKVVAEESFKGMQARAQEANYNYSYLRDESQDIAYRFGAAKTPHVFLLQRENGALKIAYIGAIDDNPKDASAVTATYVADAVNALIAGQSISVTSTKAIGCGVKWSKKMQKKAAKAKGAKKACAKGGKSACCASANKKACSKSKKQSGA